MMAAMPLQLRALPDPEKAKPCVLVVDDDDAVALAIAARLGRDFRVVGTTDPADAVAAAAREEADIVLCDINMPGMQGDEVAWALSQDPDTARIPLIYLTTLLSSDEADELAPVFGDYKAISKHAPPEDLRRAIEQALGLASDDD